MLRSERAALVRNQFNGNDGNTVPVFSETWAKRKSDVLRKFRKSGEVNLNLKRMRPGCFGKSASSRIDLASRNLGLPGPNAARNRRSDRECRQPALLNSVVL